MSWRNRWLTILALNLFVGTILGFASFVFADDAPTDQTAYVPREMEDVRQVVAPIALYPDALLAQVLAASTYPDDVNAAAQWLTAGNNPQAIDSQPWDSSVKGVARYPSILNYMAGNADWMNDLGDTFLNQQADVMTAVQDLRAEALAAGTLTTTPQQTVINEDGYIQIIPTNPQTVYVPVYDPQVVYVAPTYAVGAAYTPCITFGAGVDVGDWLDFDLDWHDHAVYFGHWGRDRPWWQNHDRDHHEIHHYADVRPGVYRPGAFKDRVGHPIKVEAGRWARDVRKPLPRPVRRAPLPQPHGPDRGYPPRTPAPPDRRPENPHPTDIVRQTERGKESREKAAEPPRAAPAPVRPAPEVHPAPHPVPAPHPIPAPVRPAPRPAPHPPVHSAPPPEARPSAPVRGGAMGGYQSGQDASHSANRGAQSRGKH